MIIENSVGRNNKQFQYQKEACYGSSLKQISGMQQQDLAK
ncbi:17045_t:CDS:2 [Gigaspora rosea]|nr:17045_t:CDS:2 [Gigaspora rosea]